MNNDEKVTMDAVKNSVEGMASVLHDLKPDKEMVLGAVSSGMQQLTCFMGEQAEKMEELKKQRRALMGGTED